MIKEIQLHSGTSCDYVFLSSITPGDDYFFKNLNRNSTTVKYGDTFSVVGATFDNETHPLAATNPLFKGTSLKGMVIKRKNIKESFYIDAGEIPYVENYTPVFIDYALKSGEQYQYAFFPKTKDGNGNEHLENPIYYSNTIVDTNWDHWVLYIGDTYNNNKNMVLVDKIFLFDLNVTSGQMNLGTKYSQQENFTPYPKIQRNYANNWSGSLKGLLGTIALNDVDFIQTPNMLQEWKNLAQNNQRKFLKDRDGNLWEVELTAAPSINNTDNLTFDLKEKSLSWTEIADASNVALFAFPSKEHWILTETGYDNPGWNYQILSGEVITAKEILTDTQKIGGMLL